MTHSTARLIQTEGASHIYSAAVQRLAQKISVFGIDALQAKLSPRARAYVFAGAVRDTLLSIVRNTDLAPKDVDIGVGG